MYNVSFETGSDREYVSELEMSRKIYFEIMSGDACASACTQPPISYNVT